MYNVVLMLHAYLRLVSTKPIVSWGQTHTAMQLHNKEELSLQLLYTVVCESLHVYSYGCHDSGQ